VEPREESACDRAKHFVVIAESCTGIVINPDGTRILGMVAPSLEFESESQARNFARLHTDANPDHECIVVDGLGREVAAFRPPPAAIQILRKPWWRFW